MSSRKTLGMFLILAVANEACLADGFVVVELTDGRYVSGNVDANTDEHHLVLRSSTPSILARSSFLWRSVKRARHGKKTYNVDGFKRVAEKLRTRAPKHLPTPKRGKQPQVAPEAPQTGRRSTHVSSLRVEAYVANWDADAEDDGLLIHVYATSIDGQQIATNGTLEVRLVGRSLDIAQTNWKRDLFPKIGEWSHQVRPQDFHRWGAVYRLPFQKIDPQFQLGIEPEGLLTARLSVPGRGTFAASDANVVLRPYSRMRDESQMKRGTRIFREEYPSRR